jgi:hypothetical protein
MLFVNRFYTYVSGERCFCSCTFFLAFQVMITFINLSDLEIGYKNKVQVLFWE